MGNTSLDIGAPVDKRARALLRDQLANGPRCGDLVIAAAAEAEISERFLIAAADRLGVRSRRGQWLLPAVNAVTPGVTRV